MIVWGLCRHRGQTQRHRAGVGHGLGAGGGGGGLAGGGGATRAEAAVRLGTRRPYASERRQPRLPGVLCLGDLAALATWQPYRPPALQSRPSCPGARPDDKPIRPTTRVGTFHVIAISLSLQ